MPDDDVAVAQERHWHGKYPRCCAFRSVTQEAIVVNILADILIHPDGRYLPFELFDYVGIISEEYGALLTENVCYLNHMVQGEWNACV